MNIGAAIREARKKQGLSQWEFARAIGTSQTHISQIELGNNKPGYKLLDSISKQFQIPIAIIFWYAVEKEDIRPEKQNSYNILKSPIDSMLNEII